MVDVMGSADILVDVIAEVSLAFGLDLSGESVRAFLGAGQDATQLALKTKIQGDDLDLDVTMGPLTASIDGGTVTLEELLE